MSDFERDPRNDELEIPERLRADLRALEEPVPEVPVSLDAAILAEAAERLGGDRASETSDADSTESIISFDEAAARVAEERAARESRSADSRPAGAAPGSGPRYGMWAAILIVAVVVWIGRLTWFGPEASAKDIDGNGRVDILDAFVLAKRLEGGEAPPETWDFTGEGQINVDDANAIAREVVALDPSGGDE